MGNNRKEVQACADWITGSNDNDGITDDPAPGCDSN